MTALPSYSYTDTEAYGARRRSLVYAYEDAPTTEILVVDGLTTDDGLLMLYRTAVELHTDAWMLKRAGQLPPWWRLVQMVRADNLRTGKATRTAHPMGEAFVRLRGLTAAQITQVVEGWRVMAVGGPGEGRIFRNRRVQETRTVDTVREGPSDTGIRHPEAFTDAPGDATVTMPDVDTSRIAVTVVGEYTLLPQERAA